MRNRSPDRLLPRRVLQHGTGQTVLHGGLMQDNIRYNREQIPGADAIGRVGEIFRFRDNHNVKTELVIFLRPVVIKDASIDGDYGSYRHLLPGADFFSKPNPSRPRPAPPAD